MLITNSRNKYVHIILMLLFEVSDQWSVQSLTSFRMILCRKHRITTCFVIRTFFCLGCRKLRCACGAWLHRLSLAVAASWRHAECELRCAITTPRHHALACCDNAHLSLGSQMRSWGRTLRLHRTREKNLHSRVAGVLAKRPLWGKSSEGENRDDQA